MQRLMKYKWVKLMRSHLPESKGIMALWAKLTNQLNAVDRQSLAKKNTP